MPATISDVALYILGELGRQSVTDIQWYCYFAQAKSYEKYGNPIFEEDFYATDDGPVCPEFAERYEERPSISAYNIIGGSVARLSDQDKMAINTVVFRNHCTPPKPAPDDPWQMALQARRKRKILKKTMRRYFYKEPEEDTKGGSQK